MQTKFGNATVCVVGAGNVGLSLSDAFARIMKVIVYDIDENKIKLLSEKFSHPNYIFTSNPAQISIADFVFICVNTSITESKEPDMSNVEAAARVVGQNLKKGALVILECSVYPGFTEEILKPILENESGLQCDTGFKLAYSPERINLGDIEHNIKTITKIVAARNEETLNIVAELYHLVAPFIFKAKNIKTAEAAKLVENAQRDLNIAFVNELSLMFEKMGLSTKDVIEAAATKWNFQRFFPGLVGGDCIPTIPYFLVHKAEECGYHPQIILAGRAVNNSMPQHISEMAIKSISSVGKVIKGSKILIMGVTYKKNVEDTRMSPMKEVIKELLEHGIDIRAYDPLVNLVNIDTEDFGIKFIGNLSETPKVDCIILGVAHDVFKGITLDVLRNIMNPYPILIDIPGFFDVPEVKNSEFIYKRL